MELDYRKSNTDKRHPLVILGFDEAKSSFVSNYIEPAPEDNYEWVINLTEKAKQAFPENYEKIHVIVSGVKKTTPRVQVWYIEKRFLTVLSDIEDSQLNSYGLTPCSIKSSIPLNSDLRLNLEPGLYWLGK